MKKEYWHIPVMLDEVVCYAKKMQDLRSCGADSLGCDNKNTNNLGKQNVFVDCTLGGAGHSIELAKLMSKDDLLIGIDQDKNAIDAAKKKFAAEAPHKMDQTIFVKNNFGNLDEILVDNCIPGVDFVLMDLGLSSPQIDDVDRGFTFKSDCSLDMRMSVDSNVLSAQDIVNTYSQKDLANILKNNSDEKFSSQIASAIVKARETEKIKTSQQLVDIIKSAIPAYARRKGGHPAKRSFMALRIEVNKELLMLKQGLNSAIRWLNPNGIIAVISYHSLEDRTVKSVFRSMENRCTCPPDLPECVCNKKPVLEVLTKKPVLPSKTEIEENSRARSAKLRVARKVDYKN